MIDRARWVVGADHESNVAVPYLFKLGERQRAIAECRVGEYRTTRGNATKYDEMVVTTELDGHDCRRKFA